MADRAATKSPAVARSHAGRSESATPQVANTPTRTDSCGQPKQPSIHPKEVRYSGRIRDLLGFLSYVHADDALDDGRIQDLGRDIVGHYEAITAEAIELFLDRDDLHW